MVGRDDRTSPTSAMGYVVDHCPCRRPTARCQPLAVHISQVTSASTKPSGSLAGNRAPGTVPPEEDPPAHPRRKTDPRSRHDDGPPLHRDRPDDLPPDPFPPGTVAPPRTDLIPWSVRPEHRWAYPLTMLRVEGRRRAHGDDHLSERTLARLTTWRHRLAWHDLVVHYDPDTPDGFSYLPRRPGVDLDLYRDPTVS